MTQRECDIRHTDINGNMIDIKKTISTLSNKLDRFLLALFMLVGTVALNLIFTLVGKW